MTAILKLAALLHGVPADIFVSLCFVESSHNPAAVAVNDGGEDSIGICQVKLSTARDMGYRGTRAGLFDPATNATYAAKYLRYQLDRYDGRLVPALTAYNAGRSIKSRRYVDKVFAHAVNLHLEGQ